MLEHWLKTYGYAALLLGTFFGGEETIIFVAFLASLGYFKLKWVILVAAIGGSLGDQVYFYLLRNRASRLIQRSSRLSELYPKICHLINRYGSLVVFLSRFLAGLRIIIPVACATAQMPAARYSLLSFISAMLWATFFGTLAYSMGPPLIQQFKRFKANWYWIVIALSLVIVTWHLIQRRRKSNLFL